MSTSPGNRVGSTGSHSSRDRCTNGRTSGHSVHMEAAKPDLIRDVSRLIDAWCDRRELRGLAGLLPAWLSNNGLTDGWADLLKALRALSATLVLPEEEHTVLLQSIATVESFVSRK